MAKLPDKKTPSRASDDHASPPKRRSPLTDFLDASEPLHKGGFAEAPQAEFSGAPLTGSIADWAEQIEQEAEKKGARSARATAANRQSPRRRFPSAPPSPGRTARGTSMGGAASARERTAAGLNPVAGLDISLEDAETMASGGVTATVAALSALIESGNPLHKDGVLWTPHRPARPEKSEGGIAIKMVSDFEPAGDQPTAIKDLVEGVNDNDRTQVLLGVTGSGKTFTMAKVIEETQRPALILAPNKTLAAQLYSEFKKFFPENAVEYFVSYYDYYQPEAYVPADRHLHREGILDQRADRPHAPFGDAFAARARRRHHRRLGLLHLRYRLGRDLYGDDLPDADRRPARPARAARRPRRPAVQAAGHQFRPRLVPRARRHDRDLPGPP